MNYNEKTKRNTSIELLRIVSILFIVLSHYSVHGQLQFYEMNLNFNKYLIEFTNTGHLGVDIFVIITGYFLVTQAFNLSKLFKMVLQIIFYSLSIYLILILFKLEDFNIRQLAFSIFPIITNKYWFATSYIVLYILHPFINIFLKALSKKQHLLLIFIILFLWSLIPTFTYYYNMNGTELLQIFMLYCIGAFIKLHSTNKPFEKKVSKILIIFSSVTSILLYILLLFIQERISILSKLKFDHISRNSLFVILLATGIFLFFKNLNIKYNGFINNIAKCSFGVYLIHEHNMIKPLIWQNWLTNGSYENSPYLIFHMILCTLLVFVVCIIIEYLRIYLIEVPLFKILNNPICKLNKSIQKSYNSIYNRINSFIVKDSYGTK